MITIIHWSDGGVNKFVKGDPCIKDFIVWKKQKNPTLRIVCRYNINREHCDC